MCTYEGKNGTIFHFDGDCSGTCFIEAYDENNQEVRISIPGEDMLGFVKMIAGSQLISAIQNWI